MISSELPLPRFRGQDGKDLHVSPKRQAEAERIDTNHDGVCDDHEIAQYMRDQNIIRAEGTKHANVPQLVKDFKYYLQGKPLPQAEAYHTYDETVSEMQQLASARPDLVAMSSLGKTAEGRDIWALKISSNAAGDTSNKPGVVFTGVHHAREWMSLEVPLHLAQTLVNNYDSDAATKNRVDNAEIWVIPVVNPDGYEYSRTEDNWWRKNRRPITEQELGCGSNPAGRDGDPVAYGVDPNRNYYDGNPDHAYLYRAAGDTPCTTDDDFGASDDPSADDYRGAQGGSEAEIQAVQQLEYHRPNIKGIIDHHSYGEELLRPWGYTNDDPPNVKDYDEVAGLMQAAQQAAGGTVYDYHASVTDYPTTGSSENSHQINGITNFTLEMGTSFQPPAEEMDGIMTTVTAADLAFMDWVIAKNPATPAPAPVPTPPSPAPAPNPAPAPPVPTPAA